MAIVAKKIKGTLYYYEVQSYREGGKVKQRILRYFGRQDPRTHPGLKPIIKQQINATYHFGEVALLFHCAKTIKLIETIDHYMPKRQGLSHGLLLFLLAAHRLIGDKPSAEKLPRWCESTVLPFILDFKLEKINRNTIGYTMDCVINEERKIDHTLHISKDLYENAQKIFGKKEEIYFYDLTSTYFEGKQCPIARFGYSRDGLIDKLQINIGLIVNKTYGLPLMTRVFEGNINDGKTVYEMMYYAKFILKREKIMIIMDRGMDSEDNVKLIDATGDDYILGMSSKHKFVSELKNSTDPGDCETKIFDGKKFKMRRFVKNIFGKRRILVLYYNEEIAMKQQEMREHKIKCKLQLLKESKKLTLDKAKEIIDGARKYIGLEEQDGLVRWKIDKIAINRATRADGKFCIMTNKDLPGEDIFALYFSKDKVEKAFMHLKQDLNLHPTRRRLPDRVRADVFICHLGYWLLALALKLVHDKKIDIFWDGLSTEMKDVMLLEYKNRSGNFSYSYVTRKKIQQDIVDKLSLSKYMPHERAGTIEGG